MRVTADQPVGQIAAEVPNAARIFEVFGIDACCNPQVPLRHAAASAGLPTGEAVSLLSGDWSAARPGDGAGRWTLLPLKELIDEIVDRHHKYARSRLLYFDHALRLLASGHARQQPDLVKLRSGIDRLIGELIPHMLQEERVVFPYMRALEEGSAESTHHGIPGTPRFPLQTMAHTHAADSAMADDLRKLTHDFHPPANACPLQQKLYLELEQFDSDLRHHIHLENDILFPRAIEMEWLDAKEG